MCHHDAVLQHRKAGVAWIKTLDEDKRKELLEVYNKRMAAISI